MSWMLALCRTAGIHELKDRTRAQTTRCSDRTTAADEAPRAPHGDHARPHRDEHDRRRAKPGDLDTSFGN